MNDKDAENNRMITAGYNDPKTGRFAAGNPGKPKGARRKLSQATLHEIVGMKDDAVEGLRQRIAANDMDAIKFVLERIVGRNRMITLDGDQPRDVTNALIEGEISTEEAKAIATVIEKMRCIEDMDALAERLDRVEKLLRDGSL